MIYCNCVLQLKLIIYVGFQFSPSSFEFLFAFGYVNYFGMQVLIASNWVLQLKFVIYFIFHFGSYSFNFVKTLDNNFVLNVFIYFGPKGLFISILTFN